MADSLEQRLTDAYASRRAEVRARWDRDLPLQELLTDRWERARSLGFGEGASIYQSAYVYGDVQVGAGSWIGPNVLLDGSGGRLAVGAGCDVSAGVQIYTHDTVARVLSEGRQGIASGPVTIEDHVHVGAGSVVLRGVTIGHHSVVGALSLVNRDLPPYTVAFGAPCRRVGHVTVGESGEVELIYD